MQQHRPHLVAVVGLPVQIVGDAKGHEEINVRQGIANHGRIDDVLQHAGSPFPVAQIDHIRAIGPGAVKDIVPFQDKRCLTVAVI